MTRTTLAILLLALGCGVPNPPGWSTCTATCEDQTVTCKCEFEDCCPDGAWRKE